MHQRLKFNEIQSSNFQENALTRPKSAFSSMLHPTVTQMLNVQPGLKMRQCWKFSENYAQYCLSK